MSLVVPAENTDVVHNETDRVERILVVDDDVRLRTLLQRFLEDKGFVVKTAHDAAQMDRLLQRELFLAHRFRLYASRGRRFKYLPTLTSIEYRHTCHYAHCTR